MFRIISLFIIIFTKNYILIACSCDTISFDRATEWADEIFMGRIVEMKEVENYVEYDSSIHTSIWSALFEVDKKWKGSSKKYVEVFQPNTSCDFYFQFPDKPYLVYAKNMELFPHNSLISFSGLSTWMCSRTIEEFKYNNWYDNFWDDRPRLNSKYPAQISLSGSNNNWGVVCIAFISLILGVIIGRFALNRKRVIE